ncbi:MAG TPA: hypothetical protein VH328_08275, partial [Burkholderiaceae bacterium]|nr:hypothetical protein [Burkholderiaceae bacterium]
ADVPPGPGVESPLAPAEAIATLERSLRSFTTLLHAQAPDAAWLEELRAVMTAYRDMCDRGPDQTLYFLLYHCAHETAQYSVPHAMLCGAIVHLATKWMGWSTEESDALVAAALTMNVAMTDLQDALASQITSLDSTHREVIDQHAVRGRQMLEGAGVTDPLWLQVVQTHHVKPDTKELERMAPAERLTELLRRVDVYTAKLSRRKRRAACTPALAARDTFLSHGGAPDTLGATLMRVLGLYPPGSWVELRNGDIGLVIARGEKAHAPIVAAIRRSDAGLYLNPQRRDTAAPGCAIARGLSGLDTRVRVNHAKVLAA